MASLDEQLVANFHLTNFLTTTHGPRAKVMLGGSATPALSLSDIISLSTDREATSKALTTGLTSLELKFGTTRGSSELRTNIASIYSSTSQISADSVIVTNATSGANHIIYRSLLSAGDHVIIQYPIYGPCVEEPLDIGCSVSYLRLNPSDKWSTNAEDLNSLIVPGKTKMIILNNPNNPTGSHLDNDTQRAIIEVAKKHNITIHCDEIFRPLFHTSKGAEVPSSMVEHSDLEYDNICVSSSLSKCYGLSGIRIGWITTKSADVRARFLNYRLFSMAAASLLDEAVATEVMSPRCRQGILDKHHKIAKENLEMIQSFVDKYSKQVEWVRPTAGAVAFIKFKDFKSGQAVDDFDFAETLVDRKGVLVSPGGLCFEFTEKGMTDQKEFKGRVRFHFTTNTEDVKKGLEGLAEFLDEEQTAGDA